MSNENQFEQWCKTVMSDDADFCMEYGMYLNFNVRVRWQAWQAATHVASSQLTALTSQLESVVSENAALKAFGDKLDEMHNDLNGEGTGIQGRAEVACQQVALEAAMEEFGAIKTPATDAFLAEVRASGVDMMREHPAIKLCSLTHVCDEVAAQLRQGGAV
ncbi:hypothetical protein [Lelliottia amnigena]|uniref:hypothetical protein n=1 Tax=Lelliottia amnigena TaxID=61646 RepID=UPI001F35CF4C|nr:hypothetical protein [Lelliottia amnigena]